MSLENGIYVVNAGIFKVVENKAHTNKYALKLTESGSWEYAPGVIKNLRPETKVTIAQAAAYGRRTGTCMICQRHLTDPTSVKNGVGPICIGKI